MAINRPGLYAKFPEYDLTDTPIPGSGPNVAQDAKVDAAIVAAEATTDRTIFATTAYADQVVYYLAAHLLAIDPTSVNARLQKSRGDDRLVTAEDLYFPEYRRLARAACHPQVT